MSRLATVMLTVSADIDKIRIDDAVEHRISIPPPVDYPGTKKDVQMARNIGLRQTNRFHNLVNRALFCTQAGKDAETRRIGQQSEVMRHLLEYRNFLRPFSLLISIKI
jgi:hypothetical protein